VRDLRGVIEREDAQIGVLIGMEAPTKPMLKEAAEAGFYKPPALQDKYPRIQILTIEELLAGKQVAHPRLLDVTHKKAPKAAPPPKRSCHCRSNPGPTFGPTMRPKKTPTAPKNPSSHLSILAKPCQAPLLTIFRVSR